MEGGFGANVSPIYQILVCNIPINLNLYNSFLKFFGVQNLFYKKGFALSPKNEKI